MTPERSCRIGISMERDRFAAAVVESDGTVLASVERPTPTAAVTVVLPVLVEELMAQAGPRGVTLEHIQQVMVGVSEVDGLAGLPGSDRSWRRWPGQLGPVAVVRLGAATTSLPPLAGWPESLRATVSIAEACVAGGARLDGSDFEPLDTAGLVAFARKIAHHITEAFDATTPFGYDQPMRDREPMSRPGFLEGTAGVGLALHAYAIDTPPGSEWDIALVVR